MKVTVEDYTRTDLDDMTAVLWKCRSRVGSLDLQVVDRVMGLISQMRDQAPHVIEEPTRLGTVVSISTHDRHSQRLRAVKARDTATHPWYIQYTDSWVSWDEYLVRSDPQVEEGS